MATSERIDAPLAHHQVLVETEFDIAVLDRFVAELQSLQDKRSKFPFVQHPISPLLRLLRKELAGELSREPAWSKWLDEKCELENERNSEHAEALQQAREDLAPMRTGSARQKDMNDVVEGEEEKRLVKRRSVPASSHVLWALHEMLFNDESPSVDIDAKFGPTLLSSSLTALAELRAAIETELTSARASGGTVADGPFITFVAPDPIEGHLQPQVTVTSPSDFEQLPEYGGVIVETQMTLPVAGGDVGGGEQTPFLDLDVDRIHRTVARKGCDPRIDLASQAPLWHIFLKMLDAGENGTTRDNVLKGYPADVDGVKHVRARLNEELIPLSITTEQREWRLVCTKTRSQK